MTPRKPKTPKPVPLAEVISRGLRFLRAEKKLSQTQLAQKMKEIGFPTWSRTTVAEVEGKGRGRGISFAELVGLTRALNTTVLDMIGSASADVNPVEISPDGLVVGSMVDLVFTIVPPEMLRFLSDAGISKEVREIHEMYSARLYRVASQLRDFAGGFEESADLLVARSEETS